MLNEARRRIQADPEFQRESFRNVTRVDLVQCDVGQIPMKSNSINALHAGMSLLSTRCNVDKNKVWNKI
jgi:hypothetical protein